MRAGRALRRIIRDRIVAQVPGLMGRVYDRAVETTPYPYATLGPSYWTDDSTECIKARVQTVQVDIWGDAAKGVVEDLVDDVATVLDGWVDTDALTMHPLRVVLARTTDDPQPGVVHGIVQVEAMLEATDG